MAHVQKWRNNWVAGVQSPNLAGKGPEPTRRRAYGRPRRGNVGFKAEVLPAGKPQIPSFGVVDEVLDIAGWGQFGGRFPMEKLMTIDEASQLLGVKPQTLYLWVAQKRIPHRKIGRLVRFRMCDLEQFVEQQLQPVEVMTNERL